MSRLVAECHVRLTVGGILVQHERSTRLGLSVQDGIPKLLRLDRLLALALALVLLVQVVKLLAVDIGQAGALVGAHQGPLAVGFDTTHEEVGNPEGVEEVSSSDFLFTVVLSEIDKVEHVGVPRLEVDAVMSNRLISRGDRLYSSHHVLTQKHRVACYHPGRHTER